MPKWTNEEDEILIKSYKQKLNREEIKKLINDRHTVDAISNRANFLGVTVNTKWNDSEIKYLKQYYPIESWENILLNIHRDKESIISKASELNIKRTISFWSNDDITALKRLYQDNVSIENIEIYFNYKYSQQAISNKANKMGLVKKRKWTDEEIDILQKHYNNKPIEILQSLLPNRKKENIIAKARKMGLSSKSIWSDEEDKYIIENWKLIPDEIMAKYLGRTFRSIKWRREKLGLYRRDMDSKNYESITKYIRANISVWKNESMKKSDYKCILTGSKNFQIHHLYSVNTMIKEVFDILNYTPKEKFEEYTDSELIEILSKFVEVQNEYPLGECIRTDLHTLFHSLYGQYNNTPEQWYQFKSDYQNGIYNHLIKNIA